MFLNYSILNMKIHFLNSLKSRYMYSGNCKSPSRFQTCELQTSYWHFNLLYYTVNLDIKKEKKTYMYDYSPFYCLFWEKLHLSIKMSCTGLSKFFISLVLLNWGWLTFIQFFFLSKKDQLYDLIQLDILWKLKYKICIKMLV